MKSVLPDFPADSAQALRILVDAEQDQLPLPSSGRTLQRRQALARVVSPDLSLVKLFEGHTDALAILAELGTSAAYGTWATWGAEPPDASLWPGARVQRWPCSACGPACCD